jgi:hypothetical protein
LSSLPHRLGLVLVWGVGVVLAVGTFAYVFTQQDFIWHAARDAEIKATYDTYRQTGVLLIKQNGTGSWYGAVEGTGITRAAGDDDPGTYLVALLMSHVTDSPSPYTGLRWVLALFSALPMLLLPAFVTSLFRTVWAGIAMVLLPVVAWVTNDGSFIVGTNYGQFDEASVFPVYAIYALPGVVVLGALVVLGYAYARQVSTRWLVALSLVTVVVAGFANLMRGLSGIGVALALGVLWFLRVRGTRRWITAAGFAVLVGGLAVAVSLLVPKLAMDLVERQRADIVTVETSSTMANAPWDNLYLGLSWPQPMTGEESTFGVPWSDEHAWTRAAEERPGTLPFTPEFDEVMKDVYVAEVRAEPGKAARLYAERTAYTARHFAAALGLILVATILVAVVARRTRSDVARRAGGAALLGLPTLAFGLLPPVLVMPMLYYVTELVSALAFLSALAVAGCAWAVAVLVGRRADGATASAAEGA